jgi:hypothetical protein
MFRKFGRAMAGHDLMQDFLLHKTPRPIARRALVVGKEVFNPVVIQRGHAVRVSNS